MLMTIRYHALLENLGVFLWPLTAVLCVALYHAGSFVWKLLKRQAGNSLELEIINECGTLSQLVGMGGTIAGLVDGLSKIDPNNPSSLASLVAAMALAFWTTYFGLATAICCRVFIMAVPYMEQWGLGEQKMLSEREDQSDAI